MSREYERTHPWMSFDLRHVNRFSPQLWLMLGEARSKCQNLAGVPLKPAVAEQLEWVTLIKGAHATTAIEGNTLSEEQVAGIATGTFKAPPSREYQEQEVRNVIGALNHIDDMIRDGVYPKLTVEMVCGFNRRVLDGLEEELEAGTIPGKIRTHSVAVGKYRGAPAEDCEYLLARLCDWLEGPDFQNVDDSVDFSLMLMRAVMAHLYLAWIHPFGDGNGRTARLIEYVILARSGKVPLPAAHLLSNHYNLTRDQYYRELERASASGGDIIPFSAYAIEGFVDGIRGEIDTVRHHQLLVAWQNYVHETMHRFPAGKACDRQRDVVLAMEEGRWYGRAEIESLTGAIARKYGMGGDRMVTRDLNRLVKAGLLRRSTRGRYRVAVDKMAAFLPHVASPHDENETS